MSIFKETIINSLSLKDNIDQKITELENKKEVVRIVPIIPHFIGETEDRVVAYYSREWIVEKESMEVWEFIPPEFPMPGKIVPVVFEERQDYAPYNLLKFLETTALHRSDEKQEAKLSDVQKLLIEVGKDGYLPNCFFSRGYIDNTDCLTLYFNKGSGFSELQTEFADAEEYGDCRENGFLDRIEVWNGLQLIQTNWYYLLTTTLDFLTF